MSHKDIDPRDPCWRFPARSHSPAEFAEQHQLQPASAPASCPFCASKDVSVVKRSRALDPGPEHYHAKCHTCGATGPHAVQNHHLTAQYSEATMHAKALQLWSQRMSSVGEPRT